MRLSRGGKTVSMSVTAIAQAIRDAGTDRSKSSALMASLYSETIELRHVPPIPSDGPIPSRLLVEVAAKEVAILQRVLPDAVISPPTVTVDGPDIRVRGGIHGVTVGGSPVDLTTNTVFTVSDGRIVGLSSEMAPEDMKAWGEVLGAESADPSPE
jgi:hypothetical protein